MKNMLIAYYAAVCGIVIILIGFTIHGRGTRWVELNNALKSSMEDAMVMLLYEERIPQTEDEWKASFLQSLAVQINSDSDLKVIFWEADMENGILSVEATLTWKHPIGTTGSVSNCMTIIMEEYLKNT